MNATTQVDHVKAERNVLAEVRHHAVVKLYYSFQDEEFLYLVGGWVGGSGGWWYRLGGKRVGGWVGGLLGGDPQHIARCAPLLLAWGPLRVPASAASGMVVGAGNLVGAVISRH